MNKILSRTGVALCVIGFLLTLFATVALFGTPSDPSGAGEIYDRSVESYNQQVKQLAENNRNFPKPILGKTRLQMHREDTIFGIIAGSVIAVIGFVLYRWNSSYGENSST